MKDLSLLHVVLHSCLVVSFQTQSVSSLLHRRHAAAFTTERAQLQPPMANTTYGKVQGVILNNGVRAFLGIPYAAPPVGKLRWQPPQKPVKWDVYNATRQPPGCPQICNDPVDTCPYFVSNMRYTMTHSPLTHPHAYTQTCPTHHHRHNTSSTPRSPHLTLHQRCREFFSSLI